MSPGSFDHLESFVPVPLCGKTLMEISLNYCWGFWGGRLMAISLSHLFEMLHYLVIITEPWVNHSPLPTTTSPAFSLIIRASETCRNCYNLLMISLGSYFSQTAGTCFGDWAVSVAAVAPHISSRNMTVWSCLKDFQGPPAFLPFNGLSWLKGDVGIINTNSLTEVCKSL